MSRQEQFPRTEACCPQRNPQHGPAPGSARGPRSGRAPARHRLAAARLRLLLGLWLVSLLAIAQAATRRCEVGLVLGGGGARGAAHIGVLKVLERERIPVDCIAGTSMGSIVGGLYASGYKAKDIEDILTSVDWRDLFRDDPPRRELPMRRKQTDLDLLIDLELGFDKNGVKPPRGILQGEKLFLLLRRSLISTTAAEHFDQLPIPFRAVAAELATGEGVVFEEGDLATAIRASMSVPGFFQPIKLGGRMLVDGGIWDNVPVSQVQKMGATRLIVVDVGSPLLDDQQLSSPLAITNQVIATMIHRRTQETLRLLGDKDLVVRPLMETVGPASFDRTREAIRAGEVAAEAMLPALRRFAVDPQAYAAFEQRHRLGVFEHPQLDFVDVVKSRSSTADYVARRLASLQGRPLDFDAVDDVIKRVYGDGRYERITYDLVERDGQHGLKVTPVDKGWGPNFLRFGLSLSDDFAGDADYRLGVEARLTGLSSRNMEWRNRIDLGAIAGLRSELNVPFGDFSQFYLEPGAEVEFETRNLGIRRVRPALADYRFRRRTLNLEAGYDYNENLRLYTRILRGDDRAFLQVGVPELTGAIESDAGGMTIGFLRDRLNDASFPTRGSRTQVQYTHYFHALGSDEDARVLEIDWDNAIKRGQHRFLMGIHGADLIGSGFVLRGTSRLGGLTNLSGYHEAALLGERTLLGRGVYYRSFDDGTRLFTLPVYAGASLEGGQVRIGGPDDSKWILSGSVFVAADTPLGPIFLGYGQANTGEDSFYLRFGSLIRTRDTGF